MPRKKPVVTKDRFRLIAETGVENMGALLAQMTRMGLENIGYELMTDVRTFARNKPAKVRKAPPVAPKKAKKAKAQKAKKAKSKSNRGGHPRHEGPTNREVIMSAIGKRQTFTVAELTDMFRQNYREPKSVGPILSALAKEKYIKSTGDGTYAVLRKAP